MAREHLFRKCDIFGTLHAQTEAVKKRVQSLSPNMFLNASENDLVQVSKARGLSLQFRSKVTLIFSMYSHRRFHTIRHLLKFGAVNSCLRLYALITVRRQVFLPFGDDYFSRRIDSSELLPVRGRCLTKMLPVQTWHEREQEAEAIELGDQARVVGGGGGAVRVGNTG